MVALAALATAPVFAADDCKGQAGCADVKTFTATVTNLRTSKQGSNRLVSLTVHFQNKTDKPLTLGYVTDTGTLIDDKGNRYDIAGSAGVRAIGVINGTAFDPKFTLAPKEASDARFELVWKDAGKATAGATYDLDLAIREITATGADQFKLGQEHALHYSAINDAVLTAGSKPDGAASGASASTGAAATAAPATPAVPEDPCKGAGNCFNAGSFIAQVQQVTPTQYTPAGRHHWVKLNVRFTNISANPVYLGYKNASNAIIDNLGNGYVYGRPGTHDTSMQGIGLVTGRSADAQFSLTPGQSRSATFTVVRINAREPIGNQFQYDVVISELEPLGQTQVRTVRDNSLTFTGLRAGNLSMAQIPGAAAVAGDSVAQKALDLFNSIKKK